MQCTFGKTPSGERLEKVKQSPNFREGKFQNLSHTPDLAEGASYYKVTKDFFFDKDKRNQPSSALPSQKVDLHSTSLHENILVWFGHSSYYMQVDGKRILVDPVLSGNASPVSFTTRSFKGSDVYGVNDIPEIDYLFISHDHYDHLDYETILKLKPKVKKIIMGLGIGEHFESWGFDRSIFIEKDWHEEIQLGDGFTVHTAPARHFSGRGFKRNQSIWMSYVLQTPSMKIFIGGDSGYDTHFKSIGDKHGPFDLVILECGQYHQYWKYIHMMPEETAQAAVDLNAKSLLPVHWAKFSLSLHAWDDSIKRVTAAAELLAMPTHTPIIGQILNMNEPAIINKWWETVK
ncbi:MAG: MBL fold metallo-hydrolase [Bacteroidetes bacterium]|nr:MBL fold metallo-hydrolase [Bacteroidota bacterium]